MKISVKNKILISLLAVSWQVSHPFNMLQSSTLHFNPLIPKITPTTSTPQQPQNQPAANVVNPTGSAQPDVSTKALDTIKQASGQPEPFNNATVGEVRQSLWNNANSIWDNLSGISSWVKEDTGDISWKDKDFFKKHFIRTVRFPFRVISKHPLETAILTAAAVAYYRYYMNKYKKAGRGLAKDIQNGIAKGDLDRVGTDRAHIAAIIKRNKNFEEDLRTLEADLYNNIALPAR